MPSFKDKELNSIFTLCPYLDLLQDFDPSSPLEEAIKLIGYFKIHRERDQNKREKGYWKALTIYGLNGQSWRTETNEYYRAASNSKLMFTEIVPQCPKTIELIKKYTIIEQCSRIRYMLLEPGASIPIHKDSSHDPSMTLNLCLSYPSDCKFIIHNYSHRTRKIEETIAPLSPGKAFLINVAKFHRVINQGHGHRMNIIIEGPLNISEKSLLENAKRSSGLDSFSKIMSELLRKEIHSYRTNS